MEIRFLEVPLDKFIDKVLNSDGCVTEVDKCGRYIVGDGIESIPHSKIVTIFVHPESDSAFVIVSDQYGNLFECGIEYGGIEYGESSIDNFKMMHSIKDEDLPY